MAEKHEFRFVFAGTRPKERVTAAASVSCSQVRLSLVALRALPVPAVSCEFSEGVASG